MGRYIKSGQDTVELRKSLSTLQDNFKHHNKVVERNTKELAKANAEVEVQKEAKIKAMEAKLHKLESEILHGTQWVKNEEPALKVNSDDMLKKLDIL